MSKETNFYSLETSTDDQYKLESTNSIFINNGKEYFISMGRIDSYCEIFDHEKKDLILEKANTLIGFDNFNKRSNLIKINEDSNIAIYYPH